MFCLIIKLCHLQILRESCGGPPRAKKICCFRNQNKFSLTFGLSGGFNQSSGRTTRAVPQSRRLAYRPRPHGRHVSADSNAGPRPGWPCCRRGRLVPPIHSMTERQGFVRNFRWRQNLRHLCEAAGFVLMGGTKKKLPVTSSCGYPIAGSLTQRRQDAKEMWHADRPRCRVTCADRLMTTGSVWRT